MSDLQRLRGELARRAGPRRMVRTLRMALEDRIETSLDALPARTMVVDVVQPGLPHSAPHADPVGLARIVADLVDGSTVMVGSGRQGL